ncbi:MAG: hypothetical protein HYZ37_15840 [Candidatus Solibacter usitatus]|nr:hypothetical protein [Candidatus Solibacter usitatus]
MSRMRVFLPALMCAGALFYFGRSPAQTASSPPGNVFRVIFGAFRLDPAALDVAVHSEGLVALRAGLGAAVEQKNGAWHAKFTIPGNPPPFANMALGEGGAGRSVSPVPSFLIEVKESFAGNIDLTTPKGVVTFRTADVGVDSPKKFQDGLIRVERVPHTTGIALTDADEDYPALAAASNGDVYAAYISYGGTGERLMLRKLGSEPIPVVEGLIEAFRPQVGIDAAGRVWVVWSEQRKDNWDLYARAWYKNSWSEIQRLTTSPGPDIYASLAADDQGTLWLAWQGVADGKQSDIFTLTCRDGKWSTQPVITGAHPANDWQPSIAAGPGGVWVAWDSYRNGTYDIYLAKPGGQPVRITGGDRFHARPSIAADKRGRVWIAWEQGGEKWGQDTVQTNGGLNRERRVHLAVYHNGKVHEPAQISHPLWAGPMSEAPKLSFDAQGRLWLFYRVNYVQRLWQAAATYLSGNEWADPVILDRSLGRQSVHFATALAGNQLWAAYSGDDRTEQQFFYATHNNVYASRITGFGAPAVEPASGVEITVPPAAKRSYSRTWPEQKTTVGGKSYTLTWGELHRHTDIDHHGRPDGTVEDAFRYARDAAALHFFATTEHIGPSLQQGMNPMTWWRTQKFSDLHRVSGVFEPLYAYESSKTGPQGHRNIVFPRRGGRLFGGIEGPTRNDPRPLWKILRESGAPSIAIPHQLTDSGVDWNLNDPDLTPVMEIYQSRRQNYEHDGAPQPPGVEQRWGKRAGSWAWDALAKRHRVGFIASSDHMSSHMSYAAVYAEDVSREGIFRGLRERHTYAASDNIIVDFRLAANGREYMMGDEARVAGAPRFKIQVIGTGPIDRIEVISNGKVAHTETPGKKQVAMEFSGDAAGGEAYYYLRIRQTDGNLAWSSPIWVMR